jgi:hypothetical protein
MNKRVSVGDIALLVVAAIALVLLWRFFSPPLGFVLWCAAAGAALPLIYRIFSTRLPKSLLSLPFLLVFFVIFFLRDHYFAGSARNSGVFLGVFASAFAAGLCVVEFLLRPFFPLRSGKEHS